MFENVILPLWILVVLFGVFLMFWLPPQVLHIWKWQKNFRYKLLVKKTRRELRKFGTLLVYKKVGDVIAICTKKDFEASENRSHEGFVIVPNIFTFGKSKTPKFDHNNLGSTSMLKIYMGFVVQDLLGMDTRKVLDQNFAGHVSEETIVSLEPSLYVPLFARADAPEWNFPVKTRQDFIRTISKQNLVG